MAEQRALFRILLLGAHVALGALPPFTKELSDKLWAQAGQQASAGKNAEFVCGAGNWGDGPQCDQWDAGSSPCWPSAMTVSASWDTELMARWSLEMAQEFGRNGRGQLGPGINIARFAWNGRLGEYMSGEDPYFGAKMVAAMVTAYRQVPNPPLQTAKHYIPNTIETDRAGMTEVVDERTLFEVYYPPFAAAVDAGVSGVMCSYNLVKCTSGLCSGEQAYACANDDTLNKHLKQVMGFRGIVISDWDATKCQDEGSHSGGCKPGGYIKNSYAASAGLDLEMPACISFKGGVTVRAKEKVQRTYWAYLVQGQTGPSKRRLQEDGYCCYGAKDDCSKCGGKQHISESACRARDAVWCRGSGDGIPIIEADALPAAPMASLTASSGDVLSGMNLPAPAPAAAAAAVAAPVGASAPGWAQQGGASMGWPIQWKNDMGKCMEVDGASPTNGAAMVMRDCSGRAEQQFRWSGAAAKLLWAAHPDYCVDVTAHKFESGTNIQLWQCTDNDPDQVFKMSVTASGGTIESTTNPGLCIAVNGDHIQLGQCSGGDKGQLFVKGKAATVRNDPAPAPAPAALPPAAPAAAPAPAWNTGVYLHNPFGNSNPGPAPAPAPKPAHTWNTGVYKDNPFGSAKKPTRAATSSLPDAGANGPAVGTCPDAGSNNYKSPCKLDLAARIIAESATVLKNAGGVLPLSKTAKVALVGSQACAKDALAQGGGSGWNGMACNEVKKINVKNGIAGLPGGPHLACPSGGDNAEASSADVILAVVVPAKASEGTDRGTLQLEQADTELIKKYTGLGKKVVVAMNAPGPMITNTWDTEVAGIVMSWLPGQQNGRGIAMALYNEGYEASGRLPFTFPKCSTLVCSIADEKGSVHLGDKIDNKAYLTYSEKALIGYRWYHAMGKEVNYPFGFGLFAYGSAEVTYGGVTAVVDGDGVIVTAVLSHSGPREGRDVPQLYLSFPSSIPGDAESKPEWVLKGFTKVLLKPNAPTSVTFKLTQRDLSYWDDSPGKSVWVCAVDAFRVCVGANARDAVRDPQGAGCTTFTPTCLPSEGFQVKDGVSGYGTDDGAGGVAGPESSPWYRPVLGGAVAAAFSLVAALFVTGHLPQSGRCTALAQRQGTLVLSSDEGPELPETPDTPSAAARNEGGELGSLLPF